MDYQYYRDDYKGTIGEAEFNVLLPKAEAVLKMYIDDRVRGNIAKDV